MATSPRAATASRADGSTRVELPWLLPGDTGAAVSPDGRRLAFSSARSGSTEIYVADTRAGTVRRLTGNAAADDVEPAWSPDGRQLAWASGPPGAHDLFVMSADGGRKRRLVDDAANDVEPAWSPDGAQIAYASNRDGRYRLWVVDAAGGEPLRARRGSRPAAGAVVEPGGGCRRLHRRRRRQRRRVGRPGRRLAAEAGDDCARIRRPPGLVARRPPARVREQPRRRSAHLADAGRRKPAAGTRDLRAPATTRPTGAVVEDDDQPRARLAAARPRPAGADRDPRPESGREDEARIHVGRRQHRRRPDPHPGDAARGRADDAGRPARPPPGRHDRRRSRDRAPRLRVASAASPLASRAVRGLRAPPRLRRHVRRARRQERLLPARPLGACAAPPGDRAGAAEVRRRLRCTAAGGAARRRGVVGRLHRPLPRVLPRAGHRHHGARAGALRPRPPRQPGAADPRAPLLEQRRVGPDQDLAGERRDGRAHRDDRPALPRVRPTVRQADDMQRFDVLVVGAGPAGSATAIHLARGGAHVLLADRARFPRDKPCGGGVTGRALRQAPCDITPGRRARRPHLRAPAPPPPQLPAHEPRAADPDDPAPAARRVSRRAGGRGGRDLQGQRPRRADRDRRGRGHGDGRRRAGRAPTSSSAPTAPTASSRGRPGSTRASSAASRSRGTSRGSSSTATATRPRP